MTGQALDDSGGKKAALGSGALWWMTIWRTTRSAGNGSRAAAPDAAFCFRIFNPAIQSEKFDRQL